MIAGERPQRNLVHQGGLQPYEEREMVVGLVTAAGTPGTAGLWEMLKVYETARGQEDARKRAMLLSWVDEFERDLGFGSEGQPPRTAQIRKWWRDQGEPELGS